MKVRSVALFALGFTIGISVLFGFALHLVGIEVYSTYPFHTINLHFAAIGIMWLATLLGASKIGAEVNLGVAIGAASFLVLIAILGFFALVSSYPG